MGDLESERVGEPDARIEFVALCGFGCDWDLLLQAYEGGEMLRL